jgi:GGDEF domain-containing protein
MPAAELLAEIARLKAGMARAQRTIAKLEARADIDPLLDILTRRGLRMWSQMLARLSARYSGGAALRFINSDGFTAINSPDGAKLCTAEAAFPVNGK